MRNRTGIPMGRPSQLKDPVRKTILSAVRQGHTYSDVAKLAGICYETLRAWRARGRADLEAGMRSDFSVFSVAFEKARAQFVDDNLKAVSKAAKGTKKHRGQWQASAWLLERRRPELFSLNRHLIRELLKEAARLETLVGQLLAERAADSSKPANIEG